MKKNEKAGLVEKIRQRFHDHEAIFVVNQNQITVAETESLRKQLRGVNSSYLVAKNTLIRIAVKDSPFADASSHFKGQTAIVFSNDITGAAKVVSEYADKNNEKLNIVCGGYCGKVLSVDEVKILAKLPSMEELRAKVIAIIQTPAQRLATLSQAPAGQLARVLKAYSEK